jgi:hypothetical protein
VSSLEEIEKQKKKDKQLAYRDQLDQLVLKTQSAQDRGMSNQFNSENRIPQQVSQDHRAPVQKGLSHPEVERYYVRASEGHDIFQQQDYMRDQLLSKIKDGYGQQSSNVLNSFQRNYEKQEKNKQAFDRDIVEKAGREKMLKEEQRSMEQFEQKKRMERETFLMNKYTIESRLAQKKREKFDEAKTEKQRMHDSLSQLERQEYMHKENVRKLQEENTRILEEQMREGKSRRYPQNVPETTNLGNPYKRLGSFEKYSGSPNVNEAAMMKSPLDMMVSKMDQSRPAGKTMPHGDSITYSMNTLEAVNSGRRNQKGPWGEQNYHGGRDSMNI